MLKGETCPACSTPPSITIPYPAPAAPDAQSALLQRPPIHSLFFERTCLGLALVSHYLLSHSLNHSTTQPPTHTHPYIPPHLAPSPHLLCHCVCCNRPLLSSLSAVTKVPHPRLTCLRVIIASARLVAFLPEAYRRRCTQSKWTEQIQRVARSLYSTTTSHPTTLFA
jgi:hypothetical protein